MMANQESANQEGLLILLDWLHHEGKIFQQRTIMPGGILKWYHLVPCTLDVP